MLLVALPGCSDDPAGDGAGFPPKCGLPTPDPTLDVDAVPSEFVLKGAQIVRVHRTKERLSIGLNVPLSVVESFAAYKKAVAAAGFDVVGTDNEIVEAEVYVQKGDRLGAVQVRTSQCSEASVVFINIVRT